MQRMRVVLLILALPLLAAAAPDPAAFGPLRIGMSLSEAAKVRGVRPLVSNGFGGYSISYAPQPGSLGMAMVPRSVRPLISDLTPIGYAADSAYSLGSARYTVVLRPQPHNVSAIELLGKTRGRDVAACRLDMQSLVAEMDQRFGPLGILDTTNSFGLPRAISERAVRDLAAGKDVWLSDRREIFGAKPATSNAIRVARSEIDQTVVARTTQWTSGRRADQTGRYDVFVDAVHTASETTGAGGWTDCSVKAVIQYTPVDLARIEWTELQSGPALSRGEAYHSLAGAKAPASALDARIICNVMRDRGGLQSCIADGDTPGWAVSAARARLKSTGPTGVADPADQTPLFGRGVVSLQPADYPDLTREEARTATTIAAPLGWEGWAVRPSASLMQRAFPERALRLERESVVTAICQIQSDGTPACPVVESSTPDLGFEAAALQILLALRAAPSLPGGGASTGAWVKTVVAFRIA